MIIDHGFYYFEFTAEDDKEKEILKTFFDAVNKEDNVGSNVSLEGKTLILEM